MAFIPAAAAGAVVAFVAATKAIRSYLDSRNPDRVWDGDYLLVRFAPQVPSEVDGIGIDVKEVVPLRREEEFIGEDPPRRFDNRGSRSEGKFMVRASQTWRSQYTVQTEKLRTVGGGAEIGINYKIVAAKLQGKLEQALRNSISATKEETQTFEQSFEVTVPPGALQLVTLIWKNIWQVGNIDLLLNGQRVEVPYRALIRVDYDQRRGLSETLQRKLSRISI